MKKIRFISILLGIFSMFSCQKKYPTEIFFRDLFTDLVQNGDASKVSLYFAPSATISLDGKELTYEEFVKRVEWMKQRDLKVDFKHAIIQGNQASSYHFSTITENGSSSTFKVFAWMKLENNKIVRFEHIALKIQGNAEQNVVNDF